MTLEKYRHSNIGMTLTPQRLAVLEYLDGNTSHPSADDIYQAVRGKFPTMSLATVYNTLAALKDRGNIVELNLDADKKRYDPNTGDHHHAICISCKRIIDIPAGSVPDNVASMPQGFIVIKSTMEIQGICADCKRAK